MRDCASAHGTCTCWTPCSAQRTRGTSARTSVGYCLVSRCRQTRRRPSYPGQEAPHAGHTSVSPANSTPTSTSPCSRAKRTSSTRQRPLDAQQLLVESRLDHAASVPTRPDETVRPQPAPSRHERRVIRQDRSAAPLTRREQRLPVGPPTHTIPGRASSRNAAYWRHASVVSLKCAA